MCGIVALRSQDRPLAPDALHAALGSLRHRGPDGSGTWFSGDRRVALGHARLAVVDLATGAQPLFSEDGQVVAAVNGEFYDFGRIRRDLEGRGHRFRTRSDSEIAVHLYEEHGAGFVHHLRGEFALLLWDGRERRLLAARDRFGVKPLCYAVRDGALWLASEAKALFAAGVRPAWDEAAFFHAAHLQYLLPGRTLFAGVCEVPPGHLLIADSDPCRPALRRYWDLDYPQEGRGGPCAEGEVVEEIGRRLDEAVRLRLVADVPVACQLSGGLDSSAVAGLMARHLGARLPCFSVRFTEAPYDEGEIARQTAAHLGAELHEVAVSADDLADFLPDAVGQGEGLAINAHISAKFLLSRAIQRAGYKVVLTGEGADEVFGGYPHLRQDLAAALGAGPVAGLHETNLVSAGIQLPEGESLDSEAVRAALGAVPTFLLAKGTLGLRVRSVLSGEFLGRWAGLDPFAALVAAMDVPGQLAGRHRVHQALYLWTRLALAGYILRTLGDGMEMAHSVEGRLPFLDHPLFEFARGLPVSLHIRRDGAGGDGAMIEKYALRQAARPLVTDTVFRRQKHPFMAPPLVTGLGPGSPRMAQLAQDVLRGPALRALPFFDQGKVLGLLDRLPGMGPRERVATDPVLMIVLSACLLQERYRL